MSQGLQNDNKIWMSNVEKNGDTGCSTTIELWLRRTLQGSVILLDIFEGYYSF